MEIIGFLWTEGVTRPMTNGLVFLYSILGGDFGIAIIAFTMVTRLILLPLTIKQLRSTKAMQQLQPRLKALQEKNKNDRAKLQKEQMALFKEAGVNPLGCLGPMIIQLPIFIGMFYAIRNTLADTPEKLIDLSRALYSWLPLVDEAVPLKSHFLGMDLGLTPSQSGGAILVLMPLLVAGSMYVTQKMVSQPSMDPRQQQTTNMMNWMFPLMFGFFTLSFPNGLALYWIVTNVVSIALQYRVTGWGGLVKQPVPVPAVVVEPAPPARSKRQAAIEAQRPQAALPAPAPARPSLGIAGTLKRILLGSPPAAQPPATPIPEDLKAEDTAKAPETVQEKDVNARTGDDRQDRRRSNRQGAPQARSRPRRRRNNRPRQGA